MKSKRVVLEIRKLVPTFFSFNSKENSGETSQRNYNLLLLLLKLRMKRN